MNCSCGIWWMQALSRKVKRSRQEARHLIHGVQGQELVPERLQVLQQEARHLVRCPQGHDRVPGRLPVTMSPSQCPTVVAIRSCPAADHPNRPATCRDPSAAASHQQYRNRATSHWQLVVLHEFDLTGNFRHFRSRLPPFLRTFFRVEKTPCPQPTPQPPAWKLQRMKFHFLQIREQRRSAPQIGLRVGPQFVRRCATVLVSVKQLLLVSVLVLTRAFMVCMSAPCCHAAQSDQPLATIASESAVQEPGDGGPCTQFVRDYPIPSRGKNLLTMQ